MASAASVRRGVQSERGPPRAQEDPLGAGGHIRAAVQGLTASLHVPSNPPDPATPVCLPCLDAAFCLSAVSVTSVAVVLHGAPTPQSSLGAVPRSPLLTLPCGRVGNPTVPHYFLNSNPPKSQPIPSMFVCPLLSIAMLSPSRNAILNCLCLAGLLTHPKWSQPDTWPFLLFPLTPPPPGRVLTHWFCGKSELLDFFFFEEWKRHPSAPGGLKKALSQNWVPPTPRSLKKPPVPKPSPHLSTTNSICDDESGCSRPPP